MARLGSSNQGGNRVDTTTANLLSDSGGGDGGGGGEGNNNNGVVEVVKGRRRRDQGRRRRRSDVVRFPVAEERSGEEEEKEEQEVMMMMPGWLRGLMVESTFFAGCGDHEDLKKNEKNVFCLGCCLSICPHCLPSHRSHPLLQPYTINGAKVIFLNERAQARSYKGGNVCFTCDRILQYPFHFCSLSCKVDHMLCQGRDLSRILYQFQQSDFAYTQFDKEASEDHIDEDNDPQITDSSMVEAQEMGMELEANDDAQMDDPLLHFKPSLACSSHDHDSAVSTLRVTSAAFNGNDNETSMKQTKKKKKGSRGFMPGIVLSLNSCRRKGAPQRSPLS